LNFNAKVNLVFVRIFDAFCSSNLKVNEYNPLNLIILYYFDVSNVFHTSICVIYIIWHITASMSIGKCVSHVKIF